MKRLQGLLSGPTPQLIRIGVRNKGCAGLSYHLDYVEHPEKFDEVVEQDGVRVLIDSKALFSIIGSEMDWKEDPLRCVSSLGRSSQIVDISVATVRSSRSRTLISRMHVDAESRSLLAHDAPFDLVTHSHRTSSTTYIKCIHTSHAHNR